jgi:hypothetical protein
VERDKFYIVMSILCLAIVIAGFAPVYYFRSLDIVPWENIDSFSRHDRRLPVHLHLHGAALSAWYLLSVVQPVLIARKNVGLHMKTGRTGVGIAVCVLLTGVYTVFYRDAYLVDEVTALAAGNLFTLFAFAMCFAAAIKFRKLPAVHKRLMLLGSIPMLLPALSRWYVYPAYREFADSALSWLPVPPQIATPIVVGLSMIAAVFIHDLVKERRVLKPTLFGFGCIFLFSPILSASIVLTGFWQNLIEALA